MGSVDLKVEPSKFRQDNLMKLGSPNIHFKQQEIVNNVPYSPPQKSYLKRNVKTESDDYELKNEQFKTY